jgi:hypothetical protein
MRNEQSANNKIKLIAMKFKLFIISLLAIMVVGCTLESSPEPEKEAGKIVTISATVPGETRVAYDDDTRKLEWQTGDKLLLAGYDGTTYKGSEIFDWTGGNSFQGTAVPGATTYKAYYPGEIITLDGNGNMQPLAADFWQQTQNGNGMTNHLRKKLLLIDRNANAIDQTFNLALRCDILRFCLGGIPQDAGTLSRLIYTVETATGVFTSMTLNMTGVTISASLDSITAFLAFDPAVMGIAEDGKVTIRLVGNKIYEWSKIITNGMLYVAGKRYTANVSGVWTEVLINPLNPLSYFAEHNMADLNGTFETGHDASGQYLFTWYDAMTYNTTPATLNGKSYYLPTNEERRAIIPEDNSYVNFDGIGARTLSDAAVTVGGENYTMSGTFDNVGNVVYATLTYTYQSCPTLYAIARYRTENLSAGNANGRMVVDMQLTVTPYTMDEAKSADWGAVGVVSRVFPAAGFGLRGRRFEQGTAGRYWLSTESSGQGWVVGFGSDNAGSVIASTNTYEFSIRLVSRE